VKYKILRILFILLFTNLFSQEIDTNKFIFKNSMFFKITKNNNRNLIIYLHGGVNNPYFKQNNDDIKLSYIVENNNSFIQSTLENGYDLLIPITNDTLNWLTNSDKCLDIFKELLDTIPKKYLKLYISGMSDGGTGGYQIFYNHNMFFNGLIVFNGYPQYNNFYKTVDYSKITNKKVLFLSTKSDNRIFYEFLLTEYCNQKKYNANTYFYLINGEHTFSAYQKKDFEIIFDILKTNNDNTLKIPVQGFIRNDKLIKFYPYRKKVLKKYGYGKEYFLENKRQKKVIGKDKNINLLSLNKTKIINTLHNRVDD